MFLEVLQEAFGFLVRRPVAVIVAAAVVRHHFEALFDQPVKALLECRVHGRDYGCKALRVETETVYRHFPILSEFVLFAVLKILVHCLDF